MTKHSTGPAAPQGSAYAEKVILTQESIGDFLEEMARQSRSAETVKAYRRNLRILYAWLPEEDKAIYPQTLAQWRTDMLENGSAPRTVNARVAAANSMLRFLGRRELQSPAPLLTEEGGQPELTRGEYLRLLTAARRQGKERVYLLVKVFATLGLGLGELSELTVECVRIRKLSLSGGRRTYIPACLGRELEDYAARQGVTGGPVFVTREGRALHRSNVTDSIRRLSVEAQVPEEKANPRCLRRLYQITQAKMRESLNQLLLQNYDQLLEAEQVSIGWPQAAETEIA